MRSARPDIEVYVSSLNGLLTTWVIVGRRAYPFETALEAFQWVTEEGTTTSASANDRFETLRADHHCLWDSHPPSISSSFRRGRTS